MSCQETPGEDPLTLGQYTGSADKVVTETPVLRSVPSVSGRSWRSSNVEQVVLLDEDGHPVGTADKAGVHHRDTPLHLAFSCYVVNSRGEFLLTRRALAKKTWPGVWTNSCCGHPAPGESLEGAVLRRIEQELGITADRADIILPRFRYRAVMTNGVVENEICPVTRVIYDGPVRPDPAEVEEHRWIAWPEFTRSVSSGAQPISPWCADQLAELNALGPGPFGWPAASDSDLPAAYRTLTR